LEGPNSNDNPQVDVDERTSRRTAAFLIALARNLLLAEVIDRSNVIMIGDPEIRFLLSRLLSL
jgi:hypothetical protein